MGSQDIETVGVDIEIIVMNINLSTFINIYKNNAWIKITLLNSLLPTSFTLYFCKTTFK